MDKYSLNVGTLSEQTLWPQLLESIRPRTPFDLPIWNQIWFKHFGKNHSQVIICVSGKDLDHSLVVPLVSEDEKLRFWGGTDCVDYHNILGKNITANSLKPVAQWVTQSLDIKQLILESIPEGSIISALKKSFSDEGWNSELCLEDVAPRVQLPASWETYLASLSSKNRHEIRRKIRRLEENGSIEHGDLTTYTDIQNAMDTFIVLHKKSSAEKEAYMTAERELFFREAIAALAEKGLVKMAYIDMDKKRTACSLAFILDDIRYVYNSGFDPAYRHLSVGFLNHLFSISRSIDQGVKIVDFMRGNERYKYNLGCTDHQLFRLTFYRK